MEVAAEDAVGLQDQHPSSQLSSCNYNIIPTAQFYVSAEQDSSTVKPG